MKLYLTAVIKNVIKSPRAQIVHNNEKKLKCPKNLNKLTIKHRLSVTFASFKEHLHKTVYFPIHHLISGESIFLCMGQKIGLPQFSF